MSGVWRACVVCGQARTTPLFAKAGCTLVRCGDCAAVYVGDDPAAIDFDQLYDEAYYTGGHGGSTFADYVGQQTARRRHARRLLWQLRHLPPRLPRHGRLLDVGCATGFFLAEAAAHYEVQGVELSAWSAAWARDHLKLTVHTGTLHDAALPTQAFDVVTLWDVIEHVPEPVPLLAEVARVLKPDGRVVLTTGDFGSAYAQRQGEHGRDWHLMTPPWHLTMFSRASLAQAARAAGLRVLHVASEGVAGDGRFWRSRPMLLLSRLLGWGDVMRVTLARA
jgi:2-polyprenyl-3-methyl-5-hydroxy-6-metoxy-1,4-benzoquinol methylase